MKINDIWKQLVFYGMGTNVFILFIVFSLNYLFNLKGIVFYLFFIIGSNILSFYIVWSYMEKYKKLLNDILISNKSKEKFLDHFNSYMINFLSEGTKIYLYGFSLIIAIVSFIINKMDNCQNAINYTKIIEHELFAVVIAVFIAVFFMSMINKFILIICTEVYNNLMKKLNEKDN